MVLSLQEACSWLETQLFSFSYESHFPPHTDLCCISCRWAQSYGGNTLRDFKILRNWTKFSVSNHFRKGTKSVIGAESKLAANPNFLGDYCHVLVPYEIKLAWLAQRASTRKAESLLRLWAAKQMCRKHSWLEIQVRGIPDYVRASLCSLNIDL